MVQINPLTQRDPGTDQSQVCEKLQRIVSALQNKVGSPGSQVWGLEFDTHVFQIIKQLLVPT